ncbi:hypothetical protein SAMN02745181_0915 [Rubritalea squalenifaciens DSM 18772]|uniref:Uncharacterized protein n=1 Tax=Rubritalea squalenifaciens DSM 18772 TaxID=1123071 RepID=A0A1M6E2T7_9BACT|nr:hypothetical protein [Rubritalea squalenifaciens]SHI79806.1 hypothetical protein SAMN02745181_0915 [Rubritalea squalenifaciens DSM 18772]
MKRFLCVERKSTGLATLVASAAIGLIPLAAIGQNQINTSTSTEGSGKVVFTAEGLPPKAPLFFTAKALNEVKIQPSSVTQTISLDFNIVQGEADKLSLEITGDTRNLSVQGPNLKHWSVRHDVSTNEAYLDLIPNDPKAKAISAKILRNATELDKELQVTTLSPGQATGFRQETKISWSPGLQVNLQQANGCQPLKVNTSNPYELSLLSTANNSIVLGTSASGATIGKINLQQLKLNATLSENKESATITLSGTASVRSSEGGEITLLTGPLALKEFPHGAGYSLDILRGKGLNSSYTLKFSEAGEYPINMVFAASLYEPQGWQGLTFSIPHSAIVPLTLSGIPAGYSFKQDALVVPQQDTSGNWTGFLPATGICQVYWKDQKADAQGELFFTTKALVDVQVGAGMLKELTRIETKIMQGKMRTMRLTLDGPGDILAVHGDQVGNWKVSGEGDQRQLEITFTGERNVINPITIQTQYPLGQFPAKVKPLRITPENALRHSGHVRLSNHGAVRLGVSNQQGMMQLAPEQFPGANLPSKPRQVFVYRFPSAQRDWEVVADQILPEVGVNQVLVYKLSEADREVLANIELDIREAPLREWEMRIPADYAVASVTGAEVAQMIVGSTVTNGERSLKINFSKEVIGRQLIHVHLSLNKSTKAGDWKLVKINYPQAKSVRGNLGVEAALGWRLVPKDIKKLVETPLAFFPKRSAALQQAFRLRDADWEATMTVESLPQSIQADVFHLYSLRESMVYGSVLINYFVVGSPMNEWKILVPGLSEKNGLGNVIVEGQNVRSWRQDGDQLIVTLNQPTLGGSTLLVSFEQPMDAKGGTLELGKVRPMDALNEGGFIQVVSPTQVKPSILVSNGLLKLGASELPAEYRLMSSAPSLAAWQYASRDFELSMNVEWYQPSSTLGQVVDFATLDTVVSRDGQVVTEASFFIKTRGRKALELTLPENSTLWEVRADGESLNARKDGSHILVPLPPKNDPNAPVKVTLRYGSTSENASRPTAGTPSLAAPITISEWKITSDSDHLLEVIDGNAKPSEPNLTETGFEWQMKYPFQILGILLLIIASVWTLRRAKSGGWIPALGVLWIILAFVFSVNLATKASSERRVNKQSFEVVTPVVSPEQPLVITMSNKTVNEAMISKGWIAVGALGAIALIGGVARRELRNPLVQSGAAALILLGILGQHGGAIAFYGILAAICCLLFILLIQQWLQGSMMRRAKKAVTTAATAVLAMSLWFGSGDVSSASEIADSISQNWSIKAERLEASMEVKWTAKAGESIVLLSNPAVLKNIQAEGAQVSKGNNNGQLTWYLIAQRDGLITASVSYEMPMQNLTDHLWTVPTGPSAAHRLSVTVDQPNWEVSSANAISQEQKTTLAAGLSGADMVLTPVTAAALSLRPASRDPEKEPTRFFVESADIYLPSPGVVDGYHELSIRPVSGQISSLTIDTPADIMIGDVMGHNVESWRFNPDNKTLSIDLAKPASREFQLTVTSQRGLAELPQDLSLAPLSVREADTVVGILGLAFSDDAQPDNIQTEGLATANIGDFKASLLQQAQAVHSGFTLHKVYRYNKENAQLSLKIEPVEAELRVTTNQVLSLGEERIVFSITANVNILRAGIFELQFPIPQDLEIESISSPALRDWTEIERNKQRIAVLQLNGRTIGAQQFSITMAGRSPAANGSAAEWQVPHFSILNTVRQTGDLRISPNPGIRIRTINRQHISQLDARTAGSNRKGDLAFKLLQSDWKLSIGIEKLDPWVKATALQEVTLREGQTRTRLSLNYTIENAAVKTLRVQLPGLSEEEARTVRGSGASVKEIVKLDGDIWEIRLRRGIIGNVPVEIEFQRAVEQRGSAESITPIKLVDARQVTQFVTVRASGRLDMTPSETAGWRTLDWANIPAQLRNPAEGNVPGLCYQVTVPDMAMKIAVKRHDIADTLKLRIVNGTLTSVFSDHGAALTMVELKVRVVEKHTMRAMLPEKAELFSVIVNGESVDVVRQGDEHLFYVTPGAEDDRHADVRIVYRDLGEADTQKNIALDGPRFNAPIEKIDWFVRLPKGYQLASRDQSFDLIDAHGVESSYSESQYQETMQSKRQAVVEKAQDQMVQANDWISKGEYKKAEQVLNQVSSNRAVDAASNEDARVQLRKLRNEQALMGLNTRRQKIYLDNAAVGNTANMNAALEEAAKINPVFNGDTNYNPSDIDKLLSGNTQEERQAMLSIANRMVSQQLAAQPAPQAIEITMPESGQLLHFHRGVQLNADSPMTLELSVAPEHGSSWWMPLYLIILLGAAIWAILLLRK